MTALTQVQADRINDVIARAVNAYVRDKTDADLASILGVTIPSPDEIIADVMGLASIFASLPTHDEYLDRYTTTTLFLVNRSRKFRTYTPRGQVEVMLEEFAHVDQFWQDPAGFPVRYLQHAEKRMAFEVGAKLAVIEAMYWLTGRLPARTAVCESIRQGYMLSADEIAGANMLAEQDATSVVNGAVRTKVGRLAIALFESEFPELHGRIDEP